MKNLKYILLVTVFLSLFQYSTLSAQNFADKEYYLVDSLVLEELTKSDKEIIKKALTLYHAAKDDTSKIVALNNICENMMHEDWEKYQFFQYKLIKRTLKKNPKPQLKKSLLTSQANAINNIGLIYTGKGLNEQAIKYYQKAIIIQEEIGDKKGFSTTLNNLGFLYDKISDIENSLKNHQKSLKIKEEIGDKEGIAMSLHNLAALYHKQGNVVKALTYNHRALKLREKIGDKRGVSMSLGNIGLIYQHQGDIDKALIKYKEALKLKKEIGQKTGIASVLHNIGILYVIDKNMPEEGLKYLNQALEIRKSINDRQGLLSSLSAIGAIYYKQGNYEKAEKPLTTALNLSIKSQDPTIVVNTSYNLGCLMLDMNKLPEAEKYANLCIKAARKINFPNEIGKSAFLLTKIYERKGKHKLALEMYKLHITMRDSINNESTQKATIQQQAKYEYEKQKAIDDAENDKLVAIEKEEKAKQKIITFATAGGLGLVVIFLIFVFNRLQVTKKQKIVIETQKQEVEQQKEVVELAHHELEEKNQEIMDSITYAKRIQNAILPPLKVVKAYLQESFILYKPKDIVAGDFYWMETVKNKVLFAAADCTGHGVPGAMVSVVCNNALNRSVREYGLTDPGEILNKTREIVIEEFEKSDEDVQDGMDIALCSLKGSTLQYAGAHNPLWIVRKSSDDSVSSDDFVILETKANKQPIGKYDNLKPYTTHTFELQKGDSIYIFSDGFVDQFGGDKGKKFKAKAFRTLLLSVQDKSMEEQHVIIDNAFENWRGDLEQIDDVCVIGVRI